MHLSRFERTYRVAPHDLNGYGIMHGGRLLTVADETAFISSRLHAGGICLTRAIHQAVFHAPAREGELLRLTSVVALVGHSSLWIPVEVYAHGDSETLIMDAVFVFAALDAAGQPRQIEPVAAESEEEQILQDRIKHLRSGIQA